MKATMGGKATHQQMRQSPAAQRITNNADSTGNTAMAKTTAPRHPAPHQYAHQGAGTGTTHDPGHGGIT